MPKETTVASDTPRAGDDRVPAADVEAATPARRSLSRKTKLILGGIAIVVLVVAGAWYLRYKTYGQYFQNTNDAQIAADVVTIAPKVSGYVSQVMVADNEDVMQGQPLARIDPRDYNAQVAEAQARVAESRAGIENARAGIDEQGAAIEQAQAQLAAAKAKAAHDAAEVDRYTPLAQSGAEPREKLAELRLAAKQSAEQVRQQAAALEIQRRRVTSMRAQISQAQAQAQGAQAQLDAAGTNLESTLLATPIKGRVGDRSVRIGQFVQAGTRLMSIVPLEKLYVVANFKETQLGLMRPGQPAKIEVDALGGTEIDGHVASISPGTGAQFSILPPENATGNFTKIVQRVPVRIAIEATPAARKLLVPGLSVTVTIDTRSAKGDLNKIDEAQERADARSGNRAR